MHCGSLRQIGSVHKDVIDVIRRLTEADGGFFTFITTQLMSVFMVIVYESTLSPRYVDICIICVCNVNIIYCS